MSSEYIPIVIEKYNLAMLTLEKIAAIEFYPNETDQVSQNIVRYAKLTLKQINEMPEDQITNNLRSHREIINGRLSR